MVNSIAYEMFAFIARRILYCKLASTVRRKQWLQ